MLACVWCGGSCLVGQPGRPRRLLARSRQQAGVRSASSAAALKGCTLPARLPLQQWQMAAAQTAACTASCCPKAAAAAAAWQQRKWCSYTVRHLLVSSNQPAEPTLFAHPARPPPPRRHWHGSTAGGSSGAAEGSPAQGKRLGAAGGAGQAAGRPQVAAAAPHWCAAGPAGRPLTCHSLGS